MNARNCSIGTSDAKRAGLCGNTPRPVERTSELLRLFDHAPERMALPSGASLFIQPEQADNKDNQDTGHDSGQYVREVLRHRHHPLSSQSGGAPRFFFPYAARRVKVAPWEWRKEKK